MCKATFLECCRTGTSRTRKSHLLFASVLSTLFAVAEKTDFFAFGSVSVSGRIEGLKSIAHAHGSGGHGPAHARSRRLLESILFERSFARARPHSGRARGKRPSSSHDQWPAGRNPDAQSKLSQLRCSIPRNQNSGRTNKQTFYISILLCAPTKFVSTNRFD